MSKKRPTYAELEKKLAKVKALLDSERDAALLGARELEEAYIESEQNFRNSLEMCPLGVRIVTADGELFYANQAILDIAGYGTVEELRVAPRKQIYTPESYAEHNERKRKRQRGEPVPPSYEISIRRPDGEVRHLQVFREEVVWGGEKQFMAMYQDITERKRAEEALQKSELEKDAILSSMTELVVYQNLEHRVLWANRAANESVGLASEQLVGRHCYEIWQQRSEPCVGCPLERTHETGQPQEAEMTTPDGRVWFIRGYPIRDANGDIIGLVELTLDITERKQAEEALRLSEEKFSKAFRSTPDRISITTLEDGKFVEVNDSYTRFTGYTREEVIGRSSLELGSWINPENRARIVQKLKKQGRIYNEEVRLRTKSGEKSTSLFSAELININGEPCMISVATDITERKHAEEALRESEEKFYKAFHSAPQAIVITTLEDGRFIEVNDSHSRITGYTREETIGHTTTELNTWVDPEEHRRIVKILKEKGRVDNEEIQFRIKSGDTYTGLFSAELINIGGEQCIISSSTDITERKEAEEALANEAIRRRILIDESLDGIVILDENAKVYEANQRFAEMLGYSSEEIRELHTWDWDTQWTPKQLLEMGRSVDAEGLHLETCHRRKDGTVFDVEISINGAVIVGQKLIFCVCRDITERKQLEEERRKAAKLESVGTLAGGIAHDFNNILTGIMGNIGLAMRAVGTGEKDRASQRLEEAEKASLQARDLTQQLLTFARGGAPVKKTVSMAELLEESAIFALRGSNVKCEFSFPEDLWPVEVDEGQMNQVITNLVINAQEAMPEGGVININAGNTAVQDKSTLPLSEGRYVEIDIIDHGVGIKKGHLDRIFDPYFTTKQKGSGLGLATSYSIIKNHGGYITVESKVENGATFHIYLPASKKSVAVEKEAKAEVVTTGEGRILVMDDEETIREMLSKMLPLAGYKVILTEDGAEAIEQYAKAQKSGKPFGAVIMDLTIPGGMGGKEAIKKLLEIDPDAKVIVSSGYATDPIMSVYKKYGFSAVITKPYSVAQIEKVLQSLLRKKK